MRTIDANFQTHLSGESTAIAALIDIVCDDGTTFHFTDLDKDISRNGNVYLAAYGFNASAIQLALGVSGQTASFELLISDNDAKGITRNHLSNSVLKYAKLTYKLCNWRQPTQEPLSIFGGYIMDAAYGDATTCVLNCTTVLGQALNLCTDKYGQLCRWDFGDANCGYDITQTIDGPHLFLQYDDQTLILTADETSPPGYYNNGLVYFMDGPARGNSYEIITSDYINGPGDSVRRMRVTTKVPILYVLDNSVFGGAIGDQVLLYAGCDKQVDSGCSYWQNTARFGGEPFVPDQQVVGSTNSSIPSDTTGSSLVPAGTTVLPTTAVVDTSATTSTVPDGFVNFNPYAVANINVIFPQLPSGGP